VGRGGRGRAMPLLFDAGLGSLLLQLVTVDGVMRHPIDLVEICDLPQGFLRKRQFSFERMQDDAFQQVTQREFLQFRQALQNLQQVLFDPNTRLYAFNFDHVLNLQAVGTRYQCTSVPLNGTLV
jgi:hypothetical protein